MVSEKAKSYEWVQKARDLWPPELETIIKFLHNAEMISSKNNHIIYGDKATLFHGLKKFDDAIKNYEFHMNNIDEKHHPQFKTNIKKAQQQQKIDYVYPWEDQLNYFNLKSFYKNTDLFIKERNNFTDFLKNSWFNEKEILKEMEKEILKKEFRNDLFSEITHEELRWCQRILHQKFPQIKYTDGDYNNFLQIFPKMIVIIRLIETSMYMLYTSSQIYDDKFVKEIVKIQKSLEKISVNDKLNTKILTTKLQIIEELFSNLDNSKFFNLKLRVSKPCEVELNLPIFPPVSINYQWFFSIDDEFNITFSPNWVYEKLINNLTKDFNQNWQKFLEFITNEKRFNNFQEFVGFLEEHGYGIGQRTSNNGISLVESDRVSPKQLSEI